MSQIFHQNKNNQDKQRGLFICEHGLSAQPYLKQPWVWVMISQQGEIKKMATKKSLDIDLSYVYLKNLLASLGRKWIEK